MAIETTINQLGNANALALRKLGLQQAASRKVGYYAAALFAVIGASIVAGYFVYGQYMPLWAIISSSAALMVFTLYLCYRTRWLRSEDMRIGMNRPQTPLQPVSVPQVFQPESITIEVQPDYAGEREKLWKALENSLGISKKLHGGKAVHV